MNKSNKIIILLIVVSFLFFLTKMGFENKVDPLWKDTVNLVNLKTDLLENSPHKLQRIYDSIHPHTKENAMNLISNPFLPISPWKKFNELLKKIITEKKVVISGVSGTSKTTLVNRISLIIAEKKENITKITCVEGLDKDYNEEWIGYRINNGFKPGKILKLFEKCKKNPRENYVLIIDDFDKIYRSTFFGSAIWNELDNPDYKNEIEGYSKEITIPNNLYIISTIHPSYNDKIPFSSEDFRRLTHGNPYTLKPCVLELKEFLLRNNEPASKDSLISQLYYFSKINQLINERIGKSAVIGQWSGIQKPLSKNNFKVVNDFITSHITKYENIGRIKPTDFNNISYSIKNKGKVPNTNNLVTFYRKLINLGLFSELTVALLFALFSFISFTRTHYIRKKNIDGLIEDIDFIEKKYLNNTLDYNSAYGNLLFIKDDIQKLARKRKLNFSQANFLNLKLKDSIRIIDFVNGLGQNNDELSNFMKIVIADDDITKDEYEQHIKFLQENKNKISTETYQTVKQQLIKLYHKSKVKYGRE